MSSWQLWRAINYPPRNHPLFQYVLSNAKRERPGVTSGFFMWIFMCSMLTFFFTVIFQWIPYVLMILLLAFNTLYSLRWVLRISGTIASEKEQRRYDLLAALPLGVFGTSWAISAGCMHQRTSFKWMPYLVLMFVGVIVMTILITVGITAAIIENVSSTELSFIYNLRILELGIAMVPFSIAFYFDHIYSVLGSFLIGQMATIDVQYPVEAKIRALFGFLTLQVLIYTVAYGIGVLLLSEIRMGLGWVGIPALLLQVVLSFSLFMLLREWAVRMLWARLVTALYADQGELELVTTPSNAMRYMD